MNCRLRNVLGVFVLALLLLNSSAFGWGARGHKIIGSIAYLKLSPQARQKVAELLRHHPRFAEDFQNEMPAEIASADVEMQNEWIFQQAAIWPDLARGFSGPLKAEYHHPTWHYINGPVFLDPADEMTLAMPLPINVNLDVPDESNAAAVENMNVIQAIKRSEAIVKDALQPKQIRALHLAWLFHMVGDIQQPMHSAALFSADRFPLGDRGGNGVKTTQGSNLHSLWDRFPGSSSKFKISHDDAVTLMQNPGVDLAATGAAMEMNPDQWFEESHALAETVAYDADVRTQIRMLPSGQGKVTLSPTYLSENGTLAKRRLAIGGYRLATMLSDIP